jgi:hypothetical protein
MAEVSDFQELLRAGPDIEFDQTADFKIRHHEMQRHRSLTDTLADQVAPLVDIDDAPDLTHQHIG